MTMPMHNPNNDNPITYGELPEEGNRMVRVESCTEKVSKAGNEMLEFVLEVTERQQGEGYRIYYYLVSNNEYYDTNVGSLLRAFGHDASVRTAPYPGLFMNRKAVVNLRHKQDPGYEKKAEVKYFLPANETGLANSAPPASRPAETPHYKNTDNYDDDVPF